MKAPRNTEQRVHPRQRKPLQRLASTLIQPSQKEDEDTTRVCYDEAENRATKGRLGTISRSEDAKKAMDAAGDVILAGLLASY